MQNPTTKKRPTIKQILALIIFLYVVTFTGLAFTAGLLAPLF